LEKKKHYVLNVRITTARGEEEEEEGVEEAAKEEVGEDGEVV